MYDYVNYYENYEKYEDNAKNAATNVENHSVTDNICRELEISIENLNKLKNSLSNETVDSVVNGFVNSLTNYLNTTTSIQSFLTNDYKAAEQIYINLNNSLITLKKSSEESKNAVDELKRIEAKIAISKRKKSNASLLEEKGKLDEEITKLEKKEKQIKSKITSVNNVCKSLCEQIDAYITYLTSIGNCDATLGETGIKVPRAGEILAMPDIDDSNSLANSFSHFVSGAGQFIIDDIFGRYGHIVSSIDGREHIVFNQLQISGWDEFCNRAAAASIASGFAGDLDVIEEANKTSEKKDETGKKYNKIGYDSDATKDYFDKFGLSSSVKEVNTKYETIKNDILKDLQDGKMVMFDLSEPNVKGASGQKWTGNRHWLAILDIREGENGPEIFISDSAQGGTISNKANLGAGWYSIDEFDGKKIKMITTVSPKDQIIGSVSSISSNPQVANSNVTLDTNQGSIIMSSNTISGTETEATVYNVLKSYGYNDAAISGIMGNIQQESEFDAGIIGDYGRSHGICQWSESKEAGYRWTKLEKFCEENGYDPYSAVGQAEYMVHELETDYTGVNNVLKSVPNTLEGASKAAKEFTMRYEMPANSERKAKQRASMATKYYNNYIQYNNEESELV